MLSRTRTDSTSSSSSSLVSPTQGIYGTPRLEDPPVLKSRASNELLRSPGKLSERFKDSTSKLFPRHNSTPNGSPKISTGSRKLPDTTALARPSRELERYTSSIKGSSAALLPLNTEDRHKYFRTQGSAILSSSSSNSKLISIDEGSIYTFHPTMIKVPPALESPLTPSLTEDSHYIAEETYTLLKKWILPLFNGEGLRTPVEKVNFLLKLHIDATSPARVLQEFKELTITGMKKLSEPLARLPKDKITSRMTDLWQFFYSQVLPYWEAVFLPLQLAENINVRRLTVQSFRDIVLLPVSESLDAQYLSGRPRLFQCANVLAMIQSNDEGQEKINQLIKIMKVGRSQPGDRRGFVGLND